MQQFEEGISKTSKYARENGRDPSSIDYSFYITINLNEDRSKASDEARRFLSGYYNSEFHSVENFGVFGSASYCVEALEKYAGVGRREWSFALGASTP